MNRLLWALVVACLICAIASLVVVVALVVVR